MCRRVKKNNGKIYLDKKIIINHRGAQSVDTTFKHELEKKIETGIGCGLLITLVKKI